MSTSSAVNHTTPVETFAASIDGLDLDGTVASVDAAAILAAAVHLFSATVQREDRPAVIDGAALTPTDAMIACTALLRAVNVQVFELGCWQGWTG